MSIYDAFDKFVHDDWMTTALGAIIILVATFIVSRASIALLRRILKKGSLLPASSIFVNVVRVAIWLVGISFMLSTCFNVNVSAIITALGVGGIAVSLGFQDTISNLIGGLTVSISRSVEPGDNIQMGASGVKGVVRDVTLRHTTVDTPTGTHIIIPNSLMNSTALLKLAPPESISIPIVVTDSEQRLTSIAHHMEDAAEKALQRVDKLKKKPSVSFTEVTDTGFKGTLSFTVTHMSKITPATDAAIRAIAPYAHMHPIEQMLGTLEQEYLEDHGVSPDSAKATVYADRSATLVVPTADSNVAGQIKAVESEERTTITEKAGAAPIITQPATTETEDAGDSEPKDAGDGESKSVDAPEPTEPKDANASSEKAPAR